MGAKSSIEWTDATWNPVKGCTRVSRGCEHCYAERIAARFGGYDHDPLGGVFAGFAIMTPSGPRWTGRVELDESKLELPLHWRKPRRIFVNSMSDLFHERLPEEAIDHVWAVMALCPQHEFIVLTKRAARLSEYIGGRQHGRMCDIAQTINGGTHGGAPYPLPHITLGVSAEDQPTADERIGHLLRTPAARRIVSLEPLLGPICFRWSKWDDWSPHARRKTQMAPVMRDGRLVAGCTDHLDGLRMLDGVIVGGESGPGARPCNVQWIRGIVRQCKEAGVPVFVKQLGARPWGANANGNCRDPECTHPDCGVIHYRPRDRKGGDPDEWPEDLRVREWPCP